MSQTYKSYESIKKSNASVGTTLEEIITIDTKKLERIYVEVAVTTQALDQFVITARCANGATYNTLYSVAADYTSPTGLLVGASGDLTALSGATGWFILDVDAIESVVVNAAAAVDGAVTTSFSGGN